MAKRKIKKQKPLLEEGITRRMMGMAGIGKNLEEDFISQRFNEEEEEELEDEVVDELPADLGGELGGEEDMDIPAEEPAVGGGDEALVASIVTAVADAITDVTGVEVEVEGGGEELELEPEMGDDAEMDIDPEMDIEPGLEDEEEEEIPLGEEKVKEEKVEEDKLDEEKVEEEEVDEQARIDEITKKVFEKLSKLLKEKKAKK